MLIDLLAEMCENYLIQSMEMGEKTNEYNDATAANES